MDMYPTIYAFAIEREGHTTCAGWELTQGERDEAMLFIKPAPGATVSEFDLSLPPSMELRTSMRMQLGELVYEAALAHAYTPTLRYTVPLTVKPAWRSTSDVVGPIGDLYASAMHGMPEPPMSNEAVGFADSMFGVEQVVRAVGVL